MQSSASVADMVCASHALERLMQRAVLPPSFRPQQGRLSHNQSVQARVQARVASCQLRRRWPTCAINARRRSTKKS